MKVDFKRQRKESEEKAATIKMYNKLIKRQNSHKNEEEGNSLSKYIAIRRKTPDNCNSSKNRQFFRFIFAL